jgi:hypothetical protein
LATVVRAQSAAVEGRIVDEQSAAVPGVAITLTHPATGCTRQTNILVTEVRRHSAVGVNLELVGFHLSTAKPPACVIVSTTQLVPGKGPEYANLTTTETSPALKKAESRIRGCLPPTSALRGHSERP